MSDVALSGMFGPHLVTQGYGFGGERGCASVIEAIAVTEATVTIVGCNLGRNDMGYPILDRGELIQTEVEFVESDGGGVVDPSSVYLSIRSPDGELVTRTYDPDSGDIIRDDVGQYHATIDADQSGLWVVRWWSSGDGQSAEERRFMVRDALAVED